MGLTPLRFGRPRFIGVVDANVLLCSIDNDCRNGWRSRFLRMTDDDLAVLYAADHVYAEVYEKLHKFASRRGAPSVEELRRQYEDEYLPILRFVTVTPDDGQAEALGVTDPDDVPTAQLAELLGLSVVFSDDTDLRDPGIAPGDWRAAARGAVGLIDCEREMLTLGSAVFLPVRAVFWAVGASARRLGTAPWIPALVLMAAAGLVMRPPSRRRTVVEGLGVIGRALAEQLARIEADEARAMAVLQEAMFAAAPRDGLQRQLAAVLAVQLEPVTEDELAGLIMAAFPSDEVRSTEDLRASLVDGTEFVEVEPSVWQLGRVVEPWPGRLK